MIDTDKYEGHTPAPWRFGKQGATHSEDGKTAIIRPYPQLESIGGEDKVTLITIHHGDATPKDLKLMIDAPLLLAEVKRLRLLAENLYDFYVGTYDGSLHLFEQQMDWREEE